jgi:AcrR family transcriptional regulator
MAKVNRLEIIKAAARLFNQNGYHATSMQDIARSVSIKKPSLYHHFASKEAILRAILEEGMDQLIEALTAIAGSDQDCATKLAAAIHAHARIIAENPTEAAVFLREDRGLGDDYMAQYLDKRDQVERLFRDIVRQGIEENLFRETDVAIAVHGLLGMVNWMTRWYRPEGRLSAAQIADLFTDLLFNGLLAPPTGIKADESG